MAKMQYIKPAFKFHQIPLVSGAGTGCAYDSLAGDSSCTIIDPDLGMTIFTEVNSSCQIQGKPEDFCYSVPMMDYNIYNS